MFKLSDVQAEIYIQKEKDRLASIAAVLRNGLPANTDMLDADFFDPILFDHED